MPFSRYNAQQCIPVWLTFTLTRGNILFAPGGSGSSETVLHLPHIILSHLPHEGTNQTPFVGYCGFLHIQQSAPRMPTLSR